MASDAKKSFFLALADGLDVQSAHQFADSDGERVKELADLKAEIKEARKLGDSRKLSILLDERDSILDHYREMEERV